MTSQPALLVEEDGPVATVTLNRPDAMNALTLALAEQLEDCFRKLKDRPDLRIVVLKSTGKNFSAGLDLDMSDLKGKPSPQQLYRVQKQIGNIYRAMRACTQPIICLVQGAAAGGGFSFALASDIRIAADDARFNAAYITIGLTAADMGASYFLPRLVGVSVASELMMTGRFITAQRALAVGLVSEVVPLAKLEGAAQPYIEEMLRTSPMGLRLTKEALNVNIDAPSLEAAMALEDRHQALLCLTDDFGEAQRAFFEKRPPKFRDQ